MEKWETIAFSTSLLLLILSMTVTALDGKTDPGGTTGVFTLLSMILVAVTTPLGIMVERRHNIAPAWKKLLYAIATVLFVSTCGAYFMEQLNYLEYVVAVFLGVSVVLSMLLVRTTKPKKSMAHLEKTNRIFAIVFLVLVPVSLWASYAMSNAGYHLKVGLTLPLVFTLLSANKLFDDLQRLSLVNPKIEPIEQHYKNYALSEREKEIASLLTKGRTYKKISEELYISIPTVKTHASSVYKKCGVKNRSELTALLIHQ